MPNGPQQQPPFWINRLLAAGALVFLAAVSLAAWLGWSRGGGVPERPIADIAVNLGGRTVREHCTTCHPGGARAGVGREAQRHPDIAPHSVEALGCTACHLGEGMALDAVVSHGLPGLGAREVLRGRNLQASCYTCHRLAPLPGAEKAWKGYRLFLEKACDTCHRIEPAGHGGRFGPDLSSVGSQLGLPQLQEAIRDPKREPVNSTMPRYPLSRTQTRNLAFFLKSRVAFPFHTTPLWRKARTEDEGRMEAVEGKPQSGSELLRAGKCLACHRYREEDGRIAPDLTFIGLQRDETYLRDFLRDPARRIPGAAMPVVPMTAAEEEGGVGYLAGEARGPLVKRGARDLYMQLCQRCHAASGDGRGPIQPNLAGFPRAFAGNGAFFRTVADRRLLRSLEKGIPGTSMPPYGELLSDGETDALLHLIFRSFVGIGRGEKTAPRSLPERPETPGWDRSGELFGELCSRCHGRAGTGTGPEALRYLPRPRNLTNRPYFDAVSDERIVRAIYDGVAGTAMPPFGGDLSAEELWRLVARVRLLSGALHGTE